MKVTERKMKLRVKIITTEGYKQKESIKKRKVETEREEQREGKDLKETKYEAKRGQ